MALLIHALGVPRAYIPLHKAHVPWRLQDLDIDIKLRNTPVFLYSLICNTVSERNNI